MLSFVLAAPALLLPASTRPHGSAAPLAAQQQLALPPAARSAAPLMMGKKGGKKPRAENKFKKSSKKKGQGQEEKKSVKENRAAESTKSFIYTILGLTKQLPDGILIPGRSFYHRFYHIRFANIQSIGILPNSNPIINSSSNININSYQ